MKQFEMENLFYMLSSGNNPTILNLKTEVLF